jgi:hypothetical protein
MDLSSTSIANEIDLGPFYESKKFAIEGCWNTCGGSSCCKLSRFTKNSTFGQKDSQVLHLYDFELDWLIKNDQLDPEFAKTLKKNEYQVNDWKLAFYTIECGYGGLCPNHKFRPLSCFLYPYMPFFNAEGTITELANLSLFDDVFDSLKIEKPCTLFPKFSIDMYQNLIDKYLKFPKFYFYSNVYYRMKKIMTENFNKTNEEKTIEDSLEAYEAMFSLGQLISGKEVENIVFEENLKFKIFV